MILNRYSYKASIDQSLKLEGFIIYTLSTAKFGSLTAGLELWLYHAIATYLQPNVTWIFIYNSSGLEHVRATTIQIHGEEPPIKWFEATSAGIALIVKPWFLPEFPNESCPCSHGLLDVGDVAQSQTTR